MLLAPHSAAEGEKIKRIEANLYETENNNESKGIESGIKNQIENQIDEEEEEL